MPFVSTDYKRLKDVNFCKEYGDESLPSIKELISDTPDPEKDTILSYLRTNLILASPGIVKDLFNPNETIGSGNIFLMVYTLGLIFSLRMLKNTMLLYLKNLEITF